MRDSVLDSLTSVIGNGLGDLANFGQVECQHLLRLKDWAEIVNGGTEWRSKRSYGIGSFGQLTPESTQLSAKFRSKFDNHSRAALTMTTEKVYSYCLKSYMFSLYIQFIL